MLKLRLITIAILFLGFTFANAQLRIQKVHETLKGETFNFAGSGYSEIEIAGNIFDNFNLLEERK
jgi:hypothetical protein